MDNYIKIMFILQVSYLECYIYPGALNGKILKSFDLYVVDFTLKELRSLVVRQRYPFRDQQYNGSFTF